MQVADRFEIFFDEFGTAGDQNDRRLRAGRGEDRCAQIAAIRAVKVDRLAMSGNRVRGDADEVGYRELSSISRAMTLISPAIFSRPER